MKFRVKGVYQMAFFLDVDQTVEAGCEDDARALVEEQANVADHYNQECTWLEDGPEVVPE